MVEIHFHKSRPEVLLPKRESGGAFYDLHAFLLSESGRPSKRLIPPRSTTFVPTGLSIIPPKGHIIMLYSQPRLAELAVVVANAPVLDPSYSGVVEILLYNGGFQSYYVQHEERIAQFIVVPYTPITITENDNAL